MDDLQNEYEYAKNAYQELISTDFPDFDLEAYALEKTLELNEAAPEKPNPKSKKEKLGKRIFAAFDTSGDGKLGLVDIPLAVANAKKAASRTVREAGETIKSIDPAEIFSEIQRGAKGAGKVVAHAVNNAGKTITEFDVGEAVSSTQDALIDAKEKINDIELGEIASTSAKIGKTAVGVQGFQNKKEAYKIKEICSKYYDAAEALTEQKRSKLNYEITEFGEYRLRALHQTVGRFLQYLKELQQNNAAKEYEILVGTDIDIEQIEEMEQIDMLASEALRTTAISGAFGTAAVLGTPALVTASVGALATASTGTAISTLSGAAATNATMAWLGGGSLAVGGGGVAAGTAVLTGITVGATAVIALLAAGTMVSLHYGKKLTEAKEYEKNVGVAVANFEKAWIVMDGISARTSELREVTEELKWRTTSLLDNLGSLLPKFDFENENDVKIFNKCGCFIKSMAELAQTALLDDNGNLSSESMRVSGKVREVLNTEV